MVKEGEIRLKRAEVIMPAYNAEKYIGEAIESVIKQSYKLWNLTIVNDGSTDNTNNIINDFVKKFPKQIRCFVHQKNKGTVAAINTALHNANQYYLCWLSADDVYKPNMLESSIDFLEKHIQYEAVFSKYEYIDENSHFCKAWEATSFIQELNQGSEVQPYKNMFLYSNAFHGCSLLGKRTIFMRTGYFNEKFRYAHDYDYWLRLASSTTIGFTDVINVQGRIHDKQVSNKGLNAVDSIYSFVDLFLNNRKIFNQLAQKAGICSDVTGLLVGLNSRYRYYATEQKEISALIEVIKFLLSDESGLNAVEKSEIRNSNILEIGYLIIRNPEVKEANFFKEQTDKNYLYWLSKGLNLDGFIINNKGIRFDKYNEGNDIKRLCKGLERDNNVWIIEIKRKQLYEFMECHKGNVKYHVDTSLPHSFLKIGISEFMVNDSFFCSYLPAENATKLNITIWQAFFSLILMHKNVFLS